MAKSVSADMVNLLRQMLGSGPESGVEVATARAKRWRRWGGRSVRGRMYRRYDFGSSTWHMGHDTTALGP